MNIYKVSQGFLNGYYYICIKIENVRIYMFRI